MRIKSRGQRAEGREQRAKSTGTLAHLPALLLLAAHVDRLDLAPRPAFQRSHPGPGGDNYSFLWNLWWMRKALSAPELEFFQSRYLFSPFGIDLINHPHAALQGYLSATALGGMSIIAAANLYIIVSVFLNAACAYALAFDLVRTAAGRAPRRRCVRWLAVRGRTPARTFRSADGVGRPVVRALSPSIVAHGQHRRGRLAADCALPWPRMQRTTTWCIWPSSP